MLRRNLVTWSINVHAFWLHQTGRWDWWNPGCIDLVCKNQAGFCYSQSFRNAITHLGCWWCVCTYMVKFCRLMKDLRLVTYLTSLVGLGPKSVLLSQFHPWPTVGFCVIVSYAYLIAAFLLKQMVKCDFSSSWEEGRSDVNFVFIKLGWQKKLFDSVELDEICNL